ncbi:endo alpha-1,4 polygalactosaminidase [Pseudonocardia sp.]|uniref:endo alpha-1,4 polygalactosaminidase n=1 Tax=Pseudonocardia sp. TaxID=60912 RepID=UPI003D0FEF28
MTRRLALLACLALLLAACGGGGGEPPPEDATWQYQLDGTVDTSVPAGIYDIDLFETRQATVDELRAAGRTVVCYVNAGAVEENRPDSGTLPADVRGEPLDDWPDERWLDIRRLDVLEPFLAARFDLCRDKGFHGVEPDNVDGYINDTGFPLTAADQLAFNRMLARLAHERGLTVGLKNDLDQVDELVGDFDFAVNESCVEYEECAALRPFVDAGKPVLHVEYDLDLDEFCAETTAMGFRSIRKPLDLTAEWEPCPPLP